MILAAAVVLAETAAAYLAVDAFFRCMNVSPAGLEARLRGCARWYTVIAALSCLGGLAIQWRLAGVAGLAAGALNWAPWWLLWRFGLRKQFTFLFEGAKEPDPRK